MSKNPFLLLVFLFSCNKHTQKGRAFSTPELQKLVKAFEQDFSVTVTYPIYFIENFSSTPTGPIQVGVCVHGGFPLGRYVEISAAYKDSIYLPNIVYHELGHCSLDIRHYTAVTDIMNPNISDAVTQMFDFYKERMRVNYSLGRYTK